MNLNSKVYCLLICLFFLFGKLRLIAAPLKGADLCFIENKGQINNQYHQIREDIDFKIASAKGLSVFIGSNKIIYQFSKVNTSNQASTILADIGVDWSRMEVTLEGANPNVTPIKEVSSPYYEYYHLQGFNNIKASSYSRIRYKNIYPHIDWVLFVEGQQLKHEFHLSPGAKVSDIKLNYTGADTLFIDQRGNLIARCSLGEIKESAPVSFQKKGKHISSKFVLNQQQLSYQMAAFQGELIIDPSLVWATYYGGTGSDNINMIKTNGNAIYAAGTTMSTSNIATVGSYKATNPSASQDAFIFRMTQDGLREWATYYGGFSGDIGAALALGKSALFLSGSTTSASGIATTGSHQAVFSHVGFGQDAFLAKFTLEGALEWGTYYGGENQEADAYVATDDMGNVYLGGHTNSISGIATLGSHQPTIASTDWNDAYLAKFNSSGVRQWATYYGGVLAERIYKLSTDRLGNVYISGQTPSPAGIATSGTHQPAYSGSVGSTSTDGFVAKFNSNGIRQWATYYGGSASDICYATAVDDSLNVYLAGATFSTDKIASPGAYQSAWAGGPYDIFLAKLNKNGIRQWGTYYGFLGEEVAYDVQIRGMKDVFVAGMSNSIFNIASDSAYQKTLGGEYDAILLHFNDSGQRQWASYYGGLLSDYGSHISISGEQLFLCGLTKSTSGIATASSHQNTHAGLDDGFLAKFIFPFPKVPSVISEKARVEYKIYPNPLYDRLNLESQGTLETITIHNTMGQKVYAKEGVAAKEISIDLEHLLPGFYYVSINGLYQQQIFKQ
jgi:hypothetical protein